MRNIARNRQGGIVNIIVRLTVRTAPDNRLLGYHDLYVSNGIPSSDLRDWLLYIAHPSDLRRRRQRRSCSSLVL